MKIAVVSESPADEKIVAVFIDALMGRKNEFLRGVRARAGGWAGVISAIDVELKHLHYRTDAHALIAVIDSDDSPIHEYAHDAQPAADCRVCEVVGRVQRTRQTLKKRHVGYSVEVVVGLAVPAIEAWLLCGPDPHVVEARYERDMAEGHSLKQARLALKQRLYKTDQPTRQHVMADGIKAAEAQASKLADLERAFPKSFGHFARQLRAL